ncbi:T9SS type B sorting domain-containing protein [Cryomorpha ignava]|uniref:T9SS type B sorting domain-containing protein n=1 Tax=Cryomorpha ignava TaxID=101383 RepID=A0A7K3WR14_9FLAO|nr:choice-of-anchor L domain-containing protein [Cryomorpha ignava]NEN23481.1 T9SS type B sorting domain-containing protein [Cryomorpha ignava]
MILRKPVCIIGLLCFVWSFFPQNASAQNIEISNGHTPLSLAEEITGSGVQILNPVINCADSAIGKYNITSVTGFPDGPGVVLSTGNIYDTRGPNTSQSNTTEWGTPGNGLISTITNLPNFDACVLEFDVIPVGDTLRFDFTFASEEYNEYVGTPFNDVFGFFISGPGITGDPGLGDQQNIALIPGTSQYVGINTVNQGNPDIGFPAVNSQFFVNNPLGFSNIIQYDGWTKNIYAKKVVTPCETFHLKLIIADVGDREWDSSVFIEKIESNSVTLSSTTIGEIENMIEGCNDGTVTFTRTPVTNQPFIVTYFIDGTAINGSDYPLIGTDPNPATPKFITIPANSATASINIEPFADGITEGDESVKIYIGNPLCAGTVQDSLTFIIQDSLKVFIDPPLSYVCLGDSLKFNVESEGAAFSWSPDNFLNDPNIKEPTTTPDANTNYTVTATLAGCSSVATADVVVSNVQLNAAVTPIVCGGNNDGSIDLSISGGQTPYEISWVGPSGFSSTNEDISNLIPGTYVALVTDREGCTGTISVNISEIAPIAILLSSPTFLGGDNTSCFQVADGQITAAVTSGTPPYTYLWDDVAAQTTQTAVNLTAGTYTVTVTDANLCQQQESITITQPDNVTGSLVSRTNVLCNGENTGSATIIAAGGNVPYTYLWNTIPPQSGVTIVNLQAGIYTATITDINGCTGNIVVEIEQPATPISVAVSTNNVLCHGDATGSASANITGGTPPYTYQWNSEPGNNSPNISNLQAGNYSLTVIDDNGCDFVLPFNITQPPALSVNIVSQTIVSCAGDNSGGATVSASGGTLPYSFEWNTIPAETGNTISSLSAGTYTVTATDGNGCTTNLDIEITEPDTLEIDLISLDNPLCDGAANGSLEVNATGGATPYAYSWNTVPPTSGASITGLVEGNYEVTITDGNGCTTSETFELIAPDPIIISIDTIENILCSGEATGSATVSVAGGTQDYTYLWNDPANQTTATATNLEAGTYTVLVTDLNGCTASLNIILTEPALPLSAIIISSTDVICFGDSTGSAEVEASGGSGSYSYSWNDIANQQTPAASNLPAGTYTVTITDNNGCATPLLLDVTIGEPAAALGSTLTPSLFAGGTNVVCASDSTATIDLEITGGTAPYTILWDLPGLDTSTDEDLTNLAPGIYSVTVTDSNGCESTETITLNAPEPIEISFEMTPSLCFGLPTGTIDLTVSGGIPGYSILWNGPSGFTSTDLSLTTLEGGIYNLTVTDANGCMYLDAVTVTQPEDLVITVDSLSDYNGFNLSCWNSSDGEIYITPSGGTLPYSYQWNTAGNPNFSNQQDLIYLASGTYEAVLFDANGCVQNSFIDVTAPDTIAIDFNVSLFPNGYNVSCAGANDGTIEAVPSGGTEPYTYFWVGSNGYGPVAGNPIENLPPGEYSVLATDANSCSFAETVTITGPKAFNINLQAAVINGNNISCNGTADGSINLIITGGESPISINWTGPNGFTSTNEDLFDLPSGEYCVSVVDANDCEKTQCIVLTEPDPLTIQLDATFYSNAQNLNCDDSADGEILATIAGGSPGYNFSWTGPNNFTSTSLNPTGLLEGTYCLTATDLNGCTISECVTLSAPAPINIVLENMVQSSCGGASTASIDVSVLGGDPAYTFSWTGPNGFTASSEDIAGLEAGVYCLAIIDANNCTAEACYTVIAPAPLSIILSANTFAGGFEIDCNGNTNGSITSAVSGGTAPYTYTWTGPTGYSSALAAIDNLEPGTYCLDITDTNGCNIQQCIDIEEPDALLINSSINQPDCGDQTPATIDLGITGGTTPYTFNWSNGQTTEIVSVQNGNYSVIVTDANGCSASESFVITLPSPIQVIPTAPIAGAGYNIACNGGNTGSISLSIFGGSGTFLQEWTGPNGFVSSDADISGLEAGEYCVTVTDDLGCTGITCITLTQPEAIAVSFQTASPSCASGLDGSITATISGGVPTYTLLWTGPNGFTANGTTISSLESGQYCATITDFNGCTYVECVDVLTNPAIAIALSSPETNGFNISCFGDNSGEINAVVSGGVGAYTYAWTGPGGYASTDENLTNLYVGEYCLTITDANNCTSTTCITLTQAPAIALSINKFIYPNGFNTSCGGICDGSLTASFSGGAAPVTAVWTGPAGFSSNQLALTDLCAGVYQLTLTDNSGCIRDTSFTLTQPLPISINLDSPVFQGGNEIACFGDSSGSILTTITGGIGALNIDWTGPGGFTSSQVNIDNLAAGTYEITVTDENNCSATASVLLSQPAEALSATATPLVYPSGTNISCKGSTDGSVTTAITGGTAPYSFNWSGTDGFSSDDQNIDNLAAGDYTLVAEDANSCVYTINLTLTEPADSLFAEAQITSEILCAGEATGTAEVNATGGSGNYSIVWSGPDGFTSSSLAISGLAAGSYTYILQDDNGCSLLGSINLTAPQPIELSAELVAANCETASGIINISVTNGTAPYSYLWSTNATTQDLINVPAGDYSVEITDANGCVLTENFTLTSSNTLNIDASITEPACFDEANGMINAFVVTGQEPVVYSWTGPNGFAAVGSSIFDIEAGDYTVTAQDANGCEITETYTVDQPERLVIKPLTSPVFSNGFNLSDFQSGDGIIDGPRVNGGTPSLAYVWTSDNGYTSQSGNNQLNLEAGTYMLVVTDANMCTDTAYITLTEPEVLEMPNGISPNGDGFNDFFTVRGLENYPNNRLLVFNRWGNQVYEEQNYRNSNPWYGTNQDGDELAEGTYFVVVELDGADNLKGYLEIRR